MLRGPRFPLCTDTAGTETENKHAWLDTLFYSHNNILSCLVCPEIISVRPAVQGPASSLVET
ncbi:hypothetical protein PVAP13_1KG473310 [Panicum virgatum]|uniref:Uncharacterized protein n=1 Tax=Panicum virgatum TaxID=38727 RepID=A0A8T0XHP7_PANVG|nr:hypothetical protein PVAP13_1KG473310 [Panicum virgatum]